MNINQRKAGAILTYIYIFLSNTIALIYTPFALRMLGQSQYGLFGTASSFTSYLSLLSLGIGGAYIRWNAKYRAANDKEGEQRLNGMFFTIFSVVAVVALLVGTVLLFVSKYMFAKSFTASELRDLQYIILMNVINTSMTLFFTPVFANIQAYEHFLILKVVPMITTIITPIGNTLILLNGGKAVSLTTFTLVLSTINLVIYFFYARRRLVMKFVFKGFEKDVFKDIMIFSSFLFLGTLTDLLTSNTDNIVLGALCGTTAVAVYTVGHSFKSYFLQFSTAVSGVFAPKVNQMVAKNDDNQELTELMARIGRIQFYIVSLILIGYIAVGKPFICLWAGEDYDSAYWIGLFLLSGAYIPLFQNVGIEIQKAKNKHKFRSVVYLFVAILNVILTIPASMLWEGAGAAFATFFSCMIGNVLIMNIYYQRGIGLNMGYFWKQILKIVPSFIPTIIVGILVNVFIPIYKLKWLFVAILIICVVYIVFVYLLSMNSYEKELFSKPIKKVLSKFHK